MRPSILCPALLALCWSAQAAATLEVTHCHVTREGIVQIEAYIRNPSDKPVSILRCQTGAAARYSYDLIPADGTAGLHLIRFPINGVVPGSALVAPGSSEKILLCFLLEDASPGSYQVMVRSDDGQLVSKPFAINIASEYHHAPQEKRFR